MLHNHFMMCAGGKPGIIQCKTVGPVNIDPNRWYDFGYLSTTYDEDYTYLRFKRTVKYIPYYGFSGETNIREMYIPESVTSIGGYAFCDCNGLTSITIPNNVTSIGNKAFEGCSSLTSVAINSQAIVGKTYTYDSHIKNIFGSQVTEYIIGDSISSIGEWAFAHCSSLASITIPNSVTSIGDYAFLDCSGFTSVTIPNSVTSIGKGAFQSCDGLTSVTLGNSVTSIGYESFAYCPSLTSVTIPNSVTSIGDSAFYKCSSLTSVTIPNSVTSIGNNAFSGCTALTSVVWNVKNCSDFQFSKTPFFAIRTKITSFVFGDEVEYIPAYLCYNMSNLTSITIPNSVKSIGDDAFAYCSSLTSITFQGSMKEWNNIVKGSYWKVHAPATVVHCTDGDVTL